MRIITGKLKARKIPVPDVGFNPLGHVRLLLFGGHALSGPGQWLWLPG